MTICIAAIAENDRIIGASDRLLSSDEVSFEPANRKVVSLTRSIMILWAGEPSVHAQILSTLHREVQSYLAGEDVDWIDVHTIALRYAAVWSEIRNKRAEGKILLPLGLTSEKYLEGQHSLSESLSEKIAFDLLNFRMPPTQAIITGLDKSGPHIWSFADGEIRCENLVGFCAIGAGIRHANSQMMIGHHTPSKELLESVVLVHAAKKRSENAPSVGNQTDIVIVGPNLGQHIFLDQVHVDQLGSDFQKLRAREIEALRTAHNGFNDYLSTLMSREAESQAVSKIEPAEHEPT